MPVFLGALERNLAPFLFLITKANMRESVGFGTEPPVNLYHVSTAPTAPKIFIFSSAGPKRKRGNMKGPFLQPPYLSAPLTQPGGKLLKTL